MSDDPNLRAAENAAGTETTLRVLASTLRMLMLQLDDLPPEMRRRIGGLGPRSLANWHGRVLARYAELLAAREARVAARILHGGETAASVAETPPPPAP